MNTSNIASLLKKPPETIKRRLPTIKTVIQKTPSNSASPSPGLSNCNSATNGEIGKSQSQTHKLNGVTNGKKIKSTSRPTSSASSRQSLQKSETPASQHSGGRSGSEKRKRRPSPTQQPLESDSSEGSDDEREFLEPRKRSKTSVSAEPDMKRRIRGSFSFAEAEDTFQMIHSSDIASMATPDYEAALKRTFDTGKKVLLQYPGATQMEKFAPVEPRDKEDFNPIDEIRNIVDLISKYYIPEEHKPKFTDEKTGIVRKLERAVHWKEPQAFRDAIEEYNSLIDKLRRDGSIQRTLDNLHFLERPLVESILTQLYARTVSSRVEQLRKYESFSDNVYGELKTPFISRILRQTHIKSDQVFVDLGSGVGNVVFQAALEIGCESWGCEMMENCNKAAAISRTEFHARCRLWGLAPGDVHLVEHDFMKSTVIQGVLKRADVVLINNQAFTPELNESLKLMFLDLKEGCQVVSLKSFIPENHKITARNAGSVTSLFRVDKQEYFSGSVSWTDNSGSYFIQTKDSARIAPLLNRSG